MADPRRDKPNVTGNQKLFDAALRHQVGLIRFTSGEVRRVVDLLEEADRDLVGMLRNRLGDVSRAPTDFTSERWKLLLADIRVARGEAMSKVRGELSPTLRELSVMEAGFEKRIIQGSMPLSLELASVSSSSLHAIVTTQPFNGNLLGQWYGTLASSDKSNLIRTIQLGLTEGSTLDQIVRRVAGTRSEGFSNGVLAINRRNAETVVRTAVNGVANAARNALWVENADLISALRWTATLDGRTTPVCRARDGRVAPVSPQGSIPKGQPALSPSGARPPAHPGCRSVMVAVVDGIEAVGTRPFVRDTRTRGGRETNFRKEARRSGRPIQEVRKAWAQRNIGSVPAEVTYQDWLRRQPVSFQDDVLGPSFGKLFRDGGLTLPKFVDEAGKQFTLAQLRITESAAFAAAGL